jgi:hypothetical protein
MNAATYNSTKNPIITKNFDCSTGHITAQDNKLLKKALTDPESPVIVYEYREGYFVYVPTDMGNSGYLGAEEAKAIKAYGFSDAFVDLLKEASRLECKYLQLDGDAMEYKNLPTFEWPSNEQLEKKLRSLGWKETTRGWILKRKNSPLLKDPNLKVVKGVGFTMACELEGLK